MTTREKKIEGPGGVEATLVIPEHLAETYLRAVELADENAIVEQATTGRDPAAKVYEFEQGGQIVRGMTVNGTADLFRTHYKAPPMIREHVEIGRIPHPEIGMADGPPKNAEIIQVATRVMTPDQRSATWGRIDQPTFGKRKGGGWFFDIHAAAKATAKAERNGMRKLLPPDEVSKYIRTMLGKGKPAGTVRRLTENDAKGAAAVHTPFWIAQNQRFYAIASKAMGTKTIEERGQLKAFIETAAKKPIEGMTDQEIAAAADSLYEFLNSAGNEAFKAAIMAAKPLVVAPEGGAA